MNNSDMDKFYQQYKADLMDGFVSSTDIYVRRKLGGLPEQTIKDIIEELENRLKNDNSNKHT